MDPIGKAKSHGHDPAQEGPLRTHPPRRRSRLTRLLRTPSRTPHPQALTKSGAQWVCDALVEQGVEVLFGYPGGAILPIFDALCLTPRSSSS